MSGTVRLSSATRHRYKGPKALDQPTTLTALLVALLLAGAAWLGLRARRRAPLAPHALVPWTGLLFVALVAAAALAAHLLGVGQRG